MSEVKIWHNQVVGVKTAAALEKKNFKAVYVANRKEALEKISELIPADASVGIGGSTTVQEVGVLDMLGERGNTVYNHNKPGLAPEEVLEMRRKELTADVFLTGSNAVTMEGELVNVDGVGNRVGAMIFGPQKVIVVVGVNKIVPDCAAAMARIKLIAAPINNKRLNRPNPCAINGMCMDCQSPGRICNVTTIIHRKPSFTDMYIFIIGEELGF